MKFIKAWAATGGVSVGVLAWSIFGMIWPEASALAEARNVDYAVIGLITTLSVYQAPKNAG